MSVAFSQVNIGLKCSRCGLCGTFCLGFLSESFGFTFYIFSKILGGQSIAHNVSFSPSRNCRGKQNERKHGELGSAVLKIISFLPISRQNWDNQLRHQKENRRTTGKGEDRRGWRGSYFASCPFFFASSTTLAIAKRYPVGRLYTWFWENCCGIVCWWTNELERGKEGPRV